MKLIRADKKMIPMLSEFADDVFIDYYKDLIGMDQSVYMTDLFLSEAAIEDLMNKGAVFILATEDEKPVGFCEYIREDKRLFLSKLYAEKAHREKGIGKQLFLNCLQYAKDNGLESIYLTVNKYNIPSYEIYLHLGFKVVDAVVNDIGNGYVMDDYIMEYTI
ncbi:MAG: GNAT family N-acetyltransferase [Erysipelotrichaceae bacterium]|nr:GNAT family N-acetyltransferase [Erysipelotrichaceae bacterium]